MRKQPKAVRRVRREAQKPNVRRAIDEDQAMDLVIGAEDVKE